MGRPGRERNPHTDLKSTDTLIAIASRGNAKGRMSISEQWHRQGERLYQGSTPTMVGLSQYIRFHAIIQSVRRPLAVVLQDFITVQPEQNRQIARDLVAQFKAAAKVKREDRSQ